MTSARVVRFPPARRRMPVHLGRWRLLRDETRALIVAEVKTPQGPMTVVATHLAYLPPLVVRQLRQLRRLRSLARGGQVAASGVLMGDLNARPWLVRTLTGLSPVALADSRPAPEPRYQIDHVMAWGKVRATGAAQAKVAEVSDHAAVAVDVRLAGLTPE